MPGLRGVSLAAFAVVLFVGCGARTGSAMGNAPLLTGGITTMPDACYADATGHESLLSIDPMDGTAMFDGQQLVPIMWPLGYSARMAGEQVEVLDRDGQVVATTGKFYRLNGRFHAGIFQMCVITKPEEVRP